MKKRAYTRWITSFSFLLFMMYGCSSEDEFPTEVKKVAPLTKQSAQTYYQEVYGYSPRLKNAEENRIFLTPQWDLAELYSDSLWYAVESPIKFENDLIVTLISSDVIENIRSENIGNIKQVLRLVILRNKETGKTVSFIMAILPSLNYMKQKDEAIYGNKYLKRTSNLDGSVLFFGIDGQFVNGWIYENGKITAGTITQNSKLRNTKKMATYCWEQVTTTADGTEVGRVIYCEESGAGGGVDMSDRGSGLMNGLSNGGIDNDYKDPSHGGDKDINNGANSNKYHGWDLNTKYGPLGDNYPWSNLTTAEKMFVIDFPAVAKHFYDNANKAANAVSSIPGQHNGEADAIRHAYWSALNARDYGDLAKRYGDAHEENPNQPLKEKKMDLHNNAVGYKIGLQGRGDAITSGWSDQQIWNEVMKARKEGKLQLGLK